MKLYEKKTMVMKINKAPNRLSIITSGTKLKQVSEYRYLGSSIDERGSSLGEVKKRIGMRKTAFWKCKELLRRDVNMELKKRVLNCDVKSVLSYGCET